MMDPDNLPPVIIGCSDCDGDIYYKPFLCIKCVSPLCLNCFDNLGMGLCLKCESEGLEKPICTVLLKTKKGEASVCGYPAIVDNKVLTCGGKCGQEHPRCIVHKDYCKHWDFLNIKSQKSSKEHNACCNEPCAGKCNRRCDICKEHPANGLNTRPVECEMCGLMVCGIPNCHRHIKTLTLSNLNMTVNICIKHLENDKCVGEHMTYIENNKAGKEDWPMIHMVRCKRISIKTNTIQCAFDYSFGFAKCHNGVCDSALKKMLPGEPFHCHQHSTICTLCWNPFASFYKSKTILDFDVCNRCDDFLIAAYECLFSYLKKTPILIPLILRDVVVDIINVKVNNCKNQWKIMYYQNMILESKYFNSMTSKFVKPSKQVISL